MEVKNMLTYDLEKRNRQSLYEYLYQCIREDILSGKIKAGEKLPSKREMAKNHGISVITVENAYAQLMLEGYIYTKEKRGYFAGNVRTRQIEPDTAPKPKSEEKKKQWLVNFNSNHIMYDSFPFATWSRIMRQTLLDEENSFLTSPAPKGVRELRNAIAEHLQHFRGMSVNPDNIIVGAGTEYLYGIIVQLLGHNKMIALEDPGYKKIGKIYESNGVKCIHLPIDAEGLNTNDLEGCNVSAIHISPSHHFPTGRVMPIGRRHQLLHWALENNSYIIEDDYDSEFRFSGRPIPAMAGIDGRRVIYMNTFSKTLAPSIRIAYMVLPEELMEKYNRKLGFYSGTVSSFEQYTLANFISRGYYERHINRMRNYYRDYRNKIITAISQSPIYSKVTIEEENAGLHFILGIKDKIEDKKFIETLKENDINISSVSDYCYNNLEDFKHKFIINYSAVEEEKLAKALEIMDKALEESRK
jgi:GntR family transcriptional regulator/MocR family aminotransferase